MCVCVTLIRMCWKTLPIIHCDGQQISFAPFSIHNSSAIRLAHKLCGHPWITHTHTQQNVFCCTIKHFIPNTTHDHTHYTHQTQYIRTYNMLRGTTVWWDRRQTYRRRLFGVIQSATTKTPFCMRLRCGCICARRHVWTRPYVIGRKH